MCIRDRIKAEPITIISVPNKSGNTPNDFGSKSGSHLVPNNNSEKDTILKKLYDSDTRI